LTSQDIDEAQIIYTYLRQNKDNILSFLIPFSHLKSNNFLKIDMDVENIFDAILQKTEYN